MSTRLCPFCMRMPEDDNCPHCGKNINYAGSPGHLPAGYVVSGKHPYVLGAALGQGGFGITYIALDMVTRERVAIKEYYPSYCSTRTDASTITAYSNQEEVYEKGRDRFLDEARTLKSLSDLKNIVNVQDFFEANNSAYLVMEFLDGSSLKEYAAQHGKFPARKFLEQIAPLMEDLERMHQRGVVHRDIAPDNIILLPDGQLKLIDFGAARSYVGDKSMTVVVKKGFAPVEQYLSKGTTASTDVYALAATIYYCITGTVPMEAPERQYDNVPLRTPSSFGADLTPGQEKALEEAMKIQQKERTQSVQEFLDALRAKEPAKQKRAPSKPAEKKGKKKFPALLAAAAAGLVLLGGFFLLPDKDSGDADLEESAAAGQTSVTQPVTISTEAPTVFEAVTVMTEDEKKAAAEAEIRYALSLLFDRNYIADEIGRAGQRPASSFVPMGLTDADGSQFYQNAGHNGEYVGYYNVAKDAYEANYAEAYAILSKYYEVDADGKFINFPVLTYLYNTSEGHKAIGEYLQSALASVGIKMNLQKQEWNAFLNTRKNGRFSIARNGWLGDYDDPISFLDMWTTYSSNNDVQFGKGTHANLAVYDLDLTSYGYNIKVENGTWAETYDMLIDVIKSCSDKDVRYALMHRAEDLLMSTGAITPLYYYTDTFVKKPSVEGFFTNPFSWKFFSKTTVDGSDEVISVCLGDEPDTLDPALNSNSGVMTILSHLFAGLTKWDTDQNGNSTIVPDCATGIPSGVINSDGTVTYTYTLKRDLKWSNGAKLTAGDFVFAWKRAASTALYADYSYMFDIIKGYPDNLAVEAVDDLTLRVTLTADVPYWNELLAFPTYFPVYKSSVTNNWDKNASTYVSNGAYTLSKWNHGTLISLTKNAGYQHASEVTMKQILFHLNSDEQTMRSNYNAGTYHFLEVVPTMWDKTDEDYYVTGVMGTYFVCWNINEPLLPAEKRG